MSKLVLKRITFSNVIALLALFIALGGSVYAAGKLSGKTIKPASLPGNRVKPNSLTTKQIKDNTLTAGGLTATYVTTTVALPAGSTPLVTATATCPSGQKVIGGGATTGNPDNDYIQDTGPTPDHTAWTGHAYPGATAGSLNVTAICTKVIG